MGSAMVIQIHQNDFCKIRIFTICRIFFFLHIKSSNSTITELLHHTHLIWLYLNKIGLLHHKLFSKCFDGRPAAAELDEITKPTSS